MAYSNTTLLKKVRDLILKNRWVTIDQLSYNFTDADAGKQVRITTNNDGIILSGILNKYKGNYQVIQWEDDINDTKIGWTSKTPGIPRAYIFKKVINTNINQNYEIINKFEIKG